MDNDNAKTSHEKEIDRKLNALRVAVENLTRYVSYPVGDGIMPDLLAMAVLDKAWEKNEEVE